MYMSLEQAIKAQEKKLLKRVHSREQFPLAILPLTAFPVRGAASRDFIPENLSCLVLGTYFCSSSLKIETCQQTRLIASLLHCWLLTAALFPH